MDLNKHLNLPIQAARDERDLKVVVIGNYVLAVIYGLLTGAAVLGAGAAFFSPTFGSGLWFALSSLFAAIGCGLLCYANVQSAKAITAREDAVFSTYIAGVNTMAFFPLGTIFSIYSWRVLSRLSVQDMYKAPLSGAPAPAPQIKKEAANPKIKLVTPPTPAAAEPAHEPMAFHEAMAYADEKEEAMWKALEEEHRKNNPDGGN